MLTACNNGHAEIVKLLIQNKALINISCCHEQKVTPLYFAAQNNHIDVINILLKFGGDINFGKYGKIPPLSIAAKK